MVRPSSVLLIVVSELRLVVSPWPVVRSPSRLMVTEPSSFFVIVLLLSVETLPPLEFVPVVERSMVTPSSVFVREPVVSRS